MTDDPTARILVRCEGAQMPLSWRAIPWTHTLDVNTEPTTEAAVNVVIRGLAGTPLECPQLRTQDLLRILACIVRADELVSRGRDADVHGERWIREFRLCIAVHDLDVWNDPTVQRLLASSLTFGSDDRWDFAFSRHPNRPLGSVQTSLDLGDEAAKYDPTSVVLLSGGLDSLTILAEAAARGERPIAVSHWAGAGTRSKQTALLTDMKRIARTDDRFGRWTFPTLGVNIHGLGQEARERTRRTRGVLFAGLGAAVAAELGIDRILLGDNGPISLNLPINDQLVGAHASRSTHPVLLDRVSALMSAIYERPLRINNPLWSRTRTEAIEALVQLGLAPLIRTTLSCSRWGWGQHSAAVPQCGLCSQCIDRRFATIAAGVEAYDPVTTYAHDVILDPLPDATSTLLALGYVRFAQRVVDLNALELIREYPQLTEAVLPDDPDPETTMATLIDLTQRHATTVLRVLDRQRDAARTLLSRGKVAANALLLLSAVDPSLTAVPAPNAEVAISPVVIPIRGDRTSGEPNSIIRRGDVWDIEFQGRPLTINHSDGVARLAFLLSYPGKLFTANDLLVGTHGAAPASNDMFEEGDEGWHEVGDTDEDPILDTTALKQIKRTINRLEREIATAKQQGNADLVQTKQREVQEIRAYRNQGTRPGNRSQVFADMQSQQTNTVYQSLHRLIARLEERHPPLGKHLRITLVHGNQNGYRPDGEIPWIVERSPQAA